MPVWLTSPGDGEAVRLGGGVQVGQARPATDDRPLALGIHHHVPHPAQVDHQAALAHGRPTVPVPTTADRDLQVLALRKSDRRDHVLLRLAPRDDRGMTVDVAVPDQTSALIVGVTRYEHKADITLRSASTPSPTVAVTRTTLLAADGIEHFGFRSRSVHLNTLVRQAAWRRPLNYSIRILNCDW